MNRRVIVFAAVLSMAVLLRGFVPLSFFLYWPLAAVVAGVLALGARPPTGLGITLRRGEFLCDTCKYNDSRYCSRPERPNATACPDFRRTG